MPEFTLRSDDLERREVSAIAPRVAGEDDQARYRRVSANVEVGERRSPNTASSPIPDEALSGEEGRLPRQRKSKEILFGEGVLEFLDPFEPDRHFGVDERIDRERAALGALREGFAGPHRPLRVIGHDVEQDVAVDEDRQ